MAVPKNMKTKAHVGMIQTKVGMIASAKVIPNFYHPHPPMNFCRVANKAVS